MTIPDSDIDRRVLVGEYVLGLLEDQEHDEVRAWVQADRQAGAMALQWEEHFLALSDRLAPAALPDSLWGRIQSRLTGATSAGAAQARATAGAQPRMNAQPQVSAPSQTHPRTERPASAPARTGGWQRFWENASAWRWVSAGFAAATVALAVLPNWRGAEPPATRVAVLQQPGQAAQPGWVVSVLDGGDVMIKGLAALPTPAGKSIQIWTLAPGEKKPRSMGLLADRQSVRIDAELVGAVQPGQLFEFTLEQEGGSPTGLPTGPVLYIGRIVAASL